MSDDGEALQSPTAILDELLAQEDYIILSPTCHASDVWPDTEDSEGVLSPISKQIADLCGELESCLGNLSHWHDHDLREYEDEFGYQGLNCLEEEVEEQTTCWILQDADEDDIAFAARAGSAGDVTRQRPASMPDLPNLMKSRAPQVGLEKVTKAGRRAPSRQGEGPSDSTGLEPDDPQGELDTLLAECHRMSAGMSDFSSLRQLSHWLAKTEGLLLRGYISAFLHMEVVTKIANHWISDCMTKDLLCT